MKERLEESFWLSFRLFELTFARIKLLRVLGGFIANFQITIIKSHTEIKVNILQTHMQASCESKVSSSKKITTV